MTNELIADGIYRVSGMETSLKNGAWVSDAGTYLVTNQTKLADIPDARPGDIAFTAGYGHIWQLDVDSTTWVELPKTAAGTAATQAAASATAAAGSASAAATSASQAQTVADSIPADYTSLSNSVDDLKSAVIEKNNAIYNGYDFSDILFHNGWFSDGSYNPNDTKHIFDPIPTSDLIELINNSPKAGYLQYFTSWTSWDDYTYATYQGVSAGQTKAINKDYAFVAFGSQATYKSELAGIKLKKESTIDYLSHDNITGIKDAADSAVENCAELSNELNNTNTIIDNISGELNLLYATNELPFIGGGVGVKKINDHVINMYTISTAGTQFFYVFNGSKSYKSNNNTDEIIKRFSAGTYTFKFYIEDLTGTAKSINVQLCYTEGTTANYVGIGGSSTHSGTFTANNDFSIMLRVYNNVNLGTEENPTVIKFALYDGVHSDYPIFSKYTAVDELARNNVKTIANDLLPIPAYYHDNRYIENKINTLVSYYSLTPNLINFGWITDTHTPKNAGQSFKLMKYIDEHTDSVPFVVFGGDVVGDITAQDDVTKHAIEWINLMSDYDKRLVLQCRGNHDYLGDIPGGTTAYLNYNARLKYVMGNQTMAYNGECMYYYYDIPNKNTRIIVVDDYIGNSGGGSPAFNQSEINWILEIALNAQNKNIIFVTHNTADPDMYSYTAKMAPLQSIMDALKTKSNLNTTSDGLTLSHDFTGTTNTLVCALCGHGHDDTYHTDNSGVLTIMTNCDADATSSIAGYDRTVGTQNEQCFDIVSIDPDSKKIYLTRIGAGTDREFSYT